MKIKKNFTAQFFNRTFEFTNIEVEGNVYITNKGKSSVVRQFAKQLIPNFKLNFRVRSNGVSALDIYMNHDFDAERDLQNIFDVFQAGDFNGMTDTYEWDSTNRFVLKGENGENIDVWFMYVFVHDRPMYGTKAYREWELSIHGDPVYRRQFA